METKHEGYEPPFAYVPGTYMRSDSEILNFKIVMWLPHYIIDP